MPKATQPQLEVQNEEVPSGADLASEALYRAEAERDLDEEEELFNLEETIANPTSYNWEDKYRPRKPRYFNRVHTGYEWNKYNQTHYERVHVFLLLDAHIHGLAVPTIPHQRLFKGTKYGFYLFTFLFPTHIVS